MPKLSVHKQLTSILLLAALAAGAPAACGGVDDSLFESSESASSTGVSSSSSGTTGTGGTSASSGTTSTGSTSASSGTTGTSSASGSGGAPSTSSASGSGGAPSTSGASGSGGAPGIVCATTDQCVQKLGGDACKVNIACDPTTATCTYQTLDKDGDGHAPVVCGGDDCNDNDASQFSGHAEACDGKDNNCNGSVDDGATCGGLAACQGGACVCPPENTCGAACVDKTQDPANCGACNNKCPAATTCVSGKCACAAGATICNGQCVDTQTDPNNCNGCGNTCAAGYTCKAAACTCLKTSCGGACVDTQTDPNFCGNCSVKCAAGGLCDAGTCKCPPGRTLCGNVCADTKTDPKNCGGCNTQCSACQSGTCISCPVSDLFIEQDLSGSMTTSTPGGINRWDAARSAISAFILDPQSVGLGLGIGYFPVDQTCVTSTDCGTFGTCTNGVCNGTDSCKALDYAVPAVPIALLPGVQAAIQSSINVHAPTFATPQAPALEGALIQAKAYAAAHAGHKVAVVLITDGLPNECTTSGTPTDVANIAAAYANGSPQVRTFVIGIGTDVLPAHWNTIATAGGTGTAFLTSTAQDVQVALNGVRTAFATCP
jgi:hypothetical protein